MACVASLNLAKQLKKLFKISSKIVLIVIALLLVLLLAIQLAPVQNWMAQLAAKKLSEELKTEVHVNNVGFSLFDKLNLEGLLVRDKNKDTLLYAGTFRVRITDWFFLKQKAELKFIGLEDAQIHLHRTTHFWNYGFIVDYFSSPNPQKNKKKGIVLDLKSIDLKNIHLIQKDEWVGETITASADAILIDTKNVDFKTSDFDIKSIELEKPIVGIEEYVGLRPDSIRRKERLAEVDTGLKFNPGIGLSAANVKINNGTFYLNSNNRTPTSYFDTHHILISQIKGVINNVRFTKDTLKAKIDLACRERSGFELKKLKSNLRITPQIIELSKLDLRTNKSHLGDYYAMKFRHFNDDFKDYIAKVTMEGHVKDSKVHSDDIAYFAPELKNWKKQSNISGNYLGTVENFTVKSLFLRSDGITNIQGNLSMKGLPDIDKTIINFSDGTVKTNSEELSVFVPDLKEVDKLNLPALGTVLFRGNFLGTIKDFKTKGVISTNIGAVDADIAMKFPKNAEATYSGDVLTQRFNLGKFVNTSNIGLVDFKGKVAGSSFDIAQINTTLDGFFSNLEFNGYNYTNIQTNGNLIKNYFKGEVKMDDPNLDFTSTIEINLSKSKPSFNVLGDVVKSNFKNLKFTNDDIQLTGLLDLNFEGRNIDEFVGNAKILNATLLHEKNKLSFDSLILTTSVVDGEKNIKLTSNEFSLAITGKNYKLLDLPNSFQTYLNRYYPSYFSAPRVVPYHQDFQVSFQTKDFDKYASIIDKRLGGLDFASLEGSVNTDKNQFSIQANIPTLRFDKYKVYDAFIDGKGSQDSLKLTSVISHIRIGDSLNFPNTRINIVSSNDYSDVLLLTKAENTLNEASIHAGVTTLEDGVRINMDPSYFVLNDKKWNLENTGEVIIRKNFVSAEKLKFTQGLQEIKVETEFDNEVSNANNLIVKLKNVVIGDVTSLFMKSPQFEGLANGEIRLNDFFGDFKAEAKIKAEQFRMDVDSIGQLNVQAGFDKKTGIVDFKAKSPNKNYNFNTEGHYNTKDTGNETLEVNTQLSETKISLIQRFIEDVFTDVTGVATGTLSVKGNPNHPDLLGNVIVRKGGLKVNYTQVYYTFDSAMVQFQPDGINFKEFTIYDKFKNVGSVKGKLYEKSFKDMRFDFSLNTSKLLLNDTKSKDNKQFYGYATGKATVTFKGPENKAYLKIVGEATDSSHIYIPNSISKESGDADFIVFKKYGTEITAEKKKGNFDITVDLDLTINDYVAIDVILDELAGDVIKSVGDGRLKIIAGTTVPFTMKGRYNIDRGRYDFNFQSFIRKPFYLLPDADNYIEWTGDPLKADLHIDAQYAADHVSVGDLISSQQASVNSATKSYRGTVYVVASLRDKLSHPVITFSLDFPQGSPIKTDAVFGEFLARIQADQGEMLSQATSLIVFGSFAPYGQGILTGSGNNNINNLGVNTISKLLTKQVNKVVSNLLFKLTGDKSLRFDLGTSVYSSSSILDQSNGLTATSSSRIDRTNINFKVGKSFFNDNVIVSFGGDLDFNLNANSTIANGNFQWLPDLNIELILSQDRRLRGIVFSKNSLDISGSTLGRRNRQGVSLSYKRDFDRLFAIKPKDIVLPSNSQDLDEFP